jgi:inosine-uridine nucleoside N-ribohydrolase
MKSGIPITYIPSRMGREFTNFTEEEVYKIGEINEAGKFICEMYTSYWEHGYDDKRIATNDTCAILAFRHPKLFKFQKSKFVVDTEEKPGRTYITPDKNGNVNFVVGVNKKKLHKFYYEGVKKLEFLKIYSK